MSGSLTPVDFLAGQVTFNAFLPSGQGKSSSKIILLRWARCGPRWAKYKSCFPKRAFWWFFELLSWVWKYQYTQTCLFDMCCIRRNKMLVSLRGVRINSVLSFFFLEQVSSDLLHVWVLVCCVFNFAVDCIWDYCPVVLFSSLCGGMTHKTHVNSVIKTFLRIRNLGQKLLRIVPAGPLPLSQPCQCCSVMGRNDPASLQRCFWRKGEEGSISNEQYNWTCKSFDSDVLFS